MNDARAYFKLYGNMIFTIPFYYDRFDSVAKECLTGDVKVVR